MKSIVTDSATNKKIEYTEAFWSGKRTLAINGVLCEKIDKRTFICQEDKKNYEIKGNLFTGLELISESVKIEILRKLFVWEFFLCLIPFLLISFLDFFSISLGVILMFIDFLTIRYVNKIYLKILFSIGLLALGFGIYLLGLLIVKQPMPWNITAS